MKKQQKIQRHTDTFDDDGADLNAWPPPGIDPDDKQALRDALPWNQPTGTFEPIQLLEDELEDDGLTDEQRREEWFRTAPPESLDFEARWNIQLKCSDYEREKYIHNCYAHTISRIHPRDTTAGIYVGASEAFHKKVAKACEKGDTPNNHAIEMLVNDQPWRKAIAVAPDRQQPVDTFGPMQLPESRDPVAGLEQDPVPEPRPIHWSPGTPAPDIIAGAMHDFGNYLTALVARQVVAIGFTPDTEAIANARSLARTIKDYQKITQLEEDRRAGKRRKTSTGRPRKRTILDSEKLITIRLEMAEKNKKYKNKKYAAITLEESTPEADLNTDSEEHPECPPTTTKSKQKANINIR